MKKIIILILLFISIKVSAQPFFKIKASQILYGQGLDTSATGDSLIVDSLYIKLFVTGGGSGEVNTASNLGGGLANFDSKSGVDLRFNSFKALDFDLTTNVISLDYTNGQAASSLQNGYLSAGDWSIFNAKQGAITTGTNLQYITGTLSLATFPTLVSSFTNDAGYLTSVSIAGKLNISDTAAMLVNYITEYESDLKYYPISSNPAGYLTAASITGKLNISDTAAMLANYITEYESNLNYYPISSNPAGYGTGTVISVTGTADRITSTGGATPVIDISATFEALLGKVANPLSQFAATTSAQFAGVVSDETGTGSVVFSSAPTLTNPVVGTQSAGDNSTKAASTAYVDAKITHTLTFGSASQNPADATTYYFGVPYDITMGTTAQQRQIKVPYACTIIGATISILCGAGTGETFTVYIRINNTTDLTISSTVTANVSGTQTFTVTGLSQALAANDLIEGKMISPTWATNPTIFRIYLIPYFK